MPTYEAKFVVPAYHDITITVVAQDSTDAIDKAYEQLPDSLNSEPKLPDVDSAELITIKSIDTEPPTIKTFLFSFKVPAYYYLEIMAKGFNELDAETDARISLDGIDVTHYTTPRIETWNADILGIKPYSEK